MVLRALSLCSGIGGLDMGVRFALEEAGVHVRTVCYVERESFAAACLVARMDEKALDTAPIWCDVETFDCRPWRGLVDLVVACYPCQAFSLAGKREGFSSPKNLWPKVARIISELRPSIVFLENVSAHLSAGFDRVARSLQKMGYAVAAGLLQVADLEGPHKRERLFSLAVSDAGRELLRYITERLEQSSSPPDCRNAVTGDVCASLANGDVSRRQRKQQQKNETRAQSSSWREPVGNATVWPPGPYDFAAWRNPILPQPAIRRDADGLSDRLDQLRALGGSVVPIQAAMAFAVLACAHKDQE